MACLAVLLPAAGWAAATVEPQSSTTVVAGGRAGATGLGDATALEEEIAPSSSTVTVSPATVPAATPAPATATAPTTKASNTSRTTTKPPTGAAGATLPPGVPWPSMPPPTGIPNIPPASSWTDVRQGVTVRMRIEPARPVAGQPVTFFVEYSSAEECCRVSLDFGDGSTIGLAEAPACSAPPAGTQNEVVTHTYARAGSYKGGVTAMTAWPCGWDGPSSPSPPPEIHSAAITACIGVGPGAVAEKGCSPFPDVAPDQLVSPVIDPFCQVRSDCTKASTPRPGWNA